MEDGGKRMESEKEKREESEGGKRIKIERATEKRDGRGIGKRRERRRRR